MKKIKQLTVSIIVGFVLLFANKVTAQNSKILIGAGAGFATEINNLAVVAKGVYKITDEWEASLGINYYLPKIKSEFVKVNWLAFDLDAHYVFSKQNEFEAYALAGLNINSVSVKFKGNKSLPMSGIGGSVTNTGINAGTGGRYKFSDKIYGFAEAKYTIHNTGFLQLSAGILYQL